MNKNKLNNIRTTWKLDLNPFGAGFCLLLFVAYLFFKNEYLLYGLFGAFVFSVLIIKEEIGLK